MRLRGKTFFSPPVFAVTYSRQRPAVCISGCSSLGCVSGNEMTLSVMHLAWLSRNWSLSVYLSRSFPVRYEDIFTDGGGIVVTGDPSWWSFYDSPPHRLDRRGNLCCQFHCTDSLLSFEVLYSTFGPEQKLYLAFSAAICLSSSRWMPDICKSSKTPVSCF